ncbi:MAG: MarR family transcriptional regulator [Epulopiscium sp.]|nr:MarR family transcriptional regulator [Candidatus Epulonipiscium sp.]
MDNYQAILDFFSNADKPVSAGQVAEATGIDRKEVDKIMKKLKAEEKIVSPKRCYWEIKK